MDNKEKGRGHAEGGMKNYIGFEERAPGLGNVKIYTRENDQAQQDVGKNIHTQAAAFPANELSNYYSIAECAGGNMFLSEIRGAGRKSRGRGFRAIAARILLF